MPAVELIPWRVLKLGQDEMDGSITGPLNRVKEGEKGAESDFVRALRPMIEELNGIVQKRIAGQFKARIDSDGVVNAALLSFVTGIPNQEFPKLSDRKDVKRILYEIVRNKLNNEIRWNSRKKRNPDREQGGGNEAIEEIAADRRRPAAIIGAEDVKELWDEIEKAVREVDKRAIDILRLLYLGYSNREIAEIFGLGIRRIEVIVRNIKLALRLDDESGSKEDPTNA